MQTDFRFGGFAFMSRVILSRHSFTAFLLALFSWSAAIAMSCSAAAQGAPTSTQKLDLVESVGCLAEEPKGTWVLTDATEPVVSKVPYTNEVTKKEAAAKPLGNLRFTLIAISMFNPDTLRGHKVAAKGLLIKDAGGNRINVTSLQLAADSCK
jgi:hypothetical protein